jgi:beta-galactosidase
LKRDNDITLRVDYRQMGLGGIQSWGAKPLDVYTNFSKNTYKHKFRLVPLPGNIEDPSVLANLGFKNLETSNEKMKYPEIEYTELKPEPFTALTFPGTIQMENYDLGGEGLAFHDNDMVNEGGAYRKDGVDIVSVKDGYVVGYTATDEWLSYTVDVQKDGTYQFRANVSSGLDGGSFQLLLDNKPVTETIAVPAGEDWDTYQVVEGTIGKVTKGKHVLKVLFTGSYANIDWMVFGTNAQEMVVPNLSAPSLVMGDQDFRVYNLKGKLVHSLSARGISGVQEQLKKANVQGGVYLVISTDGLVRQTLLVAP